VADLPASPVDVGRYLERLVETAGKMIATARTRLAAIAAAHRLGRQPHATSRPVVKATLKRLAREYGEPRKQANGLTSEVLHHNRTSLSARRSRCETWLVHRSGIAAAP
jgi:hypothetical protein